MDRPHQIYLQLWRFPLQITPLYVTPAVLWFRWVLWVIETSLPTSALGWLIYRVSQEESTKLRESVPYVELYRYNPKHQSWTVTEIMAIEKYGLLGCPRTVRRPWRHNRPMRMPGNQTLLANIVMQWPWRDNASAAACVNYLDT